jgi:hypothetical protein
MRRQTRSRSNTAHTFGDESQAPSLECRPAIRSNRVASSHHPHDIPSHEIHHHGLGPGRAGINRSTTFEGPTQLHRDSTTASITKMARFGSENVDMRTQRAQLRPCGRITTAYDQSMEISDDSTFNGGSSPDRSYDERSQRSASPATSHGSVPSRTASYSTLDPCIQAGKKQAPPPPPSRGKKPPPPPPPPMKRSALSTTNMTYT